MAIGFKVTVEYYIDNMIDLEDLVNDFNNDPMAAYKDISDNFQDHPSNFTDNHKIIKIEMYENNGKKK